VNTLTAKADQFARRIENGEQEVELLKQRRRALSSSGLPVPPDLRERITITEEAWLADIDRRDQVLANVHSTMVLIDKLRAIVADERTAAAEGSTLTGMSMVLAGEEFPEVIGRESTRFELVDAVVQASRWFPSINSEELERERNEFLNIVCYRNGYVPITLAPLTEAEIQCSADGMAALLLIEAGAQGTQEIIDGRKKLADLGLERPFEETYRRFVGKPLERIVLSQRVIELDGTLAQRSTRAETAMPQPPEAAPRQHDAGGSI
jgi:hypothetical protein